MWYTSKHSFSRGSTVLCNTLPKILKYKWNIYVAVFNIVLCAYLHEDGLFSRHIRSLGCYILTRRNIWKVYWITCRLTHTHNIIRFHNLCNSFRKGLHSLKFKPYMVLDINYHIITMLGPGVTHYK